MKTLNWIERPELFKSFEYIHPDFGVISVESDLLFIKWLHKENPEMLKDFKLKARRLESMTDAEWENIIQTSIADKNEKGRSLKFESLYTTKDGILNIVWSNKTSSNFSRSYSLHNMPWWLVFHFFDIGVFPFTETYNIDNIKFT